MKSIAIETDVYDYLLQKVAESGQSVSTLIRNHFGIITSKTLTTDPSELDGLFESPDFRYAKGVVGRFLVLLAWLHSRHKSNFELVEKIRGRGRLYFAKDRSILEQTGRSVNPKQIPNSTFWVITTSPTQLKQDMLADAMKLLGYSATDVERARTALDPADRSEELLKRLGLA
jgi:negative modulator of initiation of replication